MHPSQYSSARINRKTNISSPGFRGIATRVALIALLAGCSAQTDRDVYAPGDSGTSTFMNRIDGLTAWLGGCSPFVQQRWDGDRWISEGGDIVCFWEGFASPVEGVGTRIDSFEARTPGTWRLAYHVGVGCSADEPLRPESCPRIGTIRSNEFVVADASDREAYCTATDGIWNPLSCGDYQCGSPPVCAAVIPGCDCGPSANFVVGEGCVEDPSCGGTAEALCVNSGGVWDPLSCGHYSCGFPPECTAVIPGCNCGPTAVFDEVFGCLAVPCGAPQD